jgi:hypothetical protein
MEKFPPRYRSPAPPPPQQYTQTVCSRDFVGNVVCNSQPGYGGSGVQFVDSDPVTPAYRASIDINADARRTWVMACLQNHW